MKVDLRRGLEKCDSIGSHITESVQRSDFGIEQTGPVDLCLTVLLYVILSLIRAEIGQFKVCSGKKNCMSDVDRA